MFLKISQILIKPPPIQLLINSMCTALGIYYNKLRIPFLLSDANVESSLVWKLTLRHIPILGRRLKCFRRSVPDFQ